jgi:hypothetical protein
VGGNERTYTDTAVGVGTYYYRITAYNSGGVGLDSDTREVDVAEQAVPSFVPVSGMSGVPDTMQAWVPIALQGAVEPSNATNTAIVWTVKSAGGTGTAISNGNMLTATTAGTVTVTATIANGLAVGSAYTRDFVIAVSPPEPNTYNVIDSAILATALTFIRSSDADHFTIIVVADINLDPYDLTPAVYQGKTIELKGDTPARTVSLASVGSLFTVGEDVTLELEDIVLEGRSDNNASLVQVDGGTLMMKSGSKISGNTKTTSDSVPSSGGGVYISNDGLFTMDSGEISGNTAIIGGGVYVNSGTFTMNGGKVSGNDASGGGGGVRVHEGMFTMNGGGKSVVIPPPVAMGYR